METITTTQYKHPLPKFIIGNTVQMPRPALLDKETIGVVTEVQKVFKEVDSNGKFVSDGLCIEESTIQGGCLPRTFDGNTLTITYPERDYGTWIEKEIKVSYVFYTYSCTVKTSKMNTCFLEKRLRLINS